MRDKVSIKFIAFILCFFCIAAVSEGREKDIASPPPSGRSVSPGRLEKKIHSLINRERIKRGLRVLSWNETLHGIARKYSEDMARRGFFSHEDPEGRTFRDRYKTAGFQCRISRGDKVFLGAENISQDNLREAAFFQDGKVSYSYKTEDRIARSVVKRWMRSEGHRRNILTPYFSREGVGVAIARDGRVYVTEDFC